MPKKKPQTVTIRKNRDGSISMKSTGGFDLRKLFPAGIFPENQAKPEAADGQRKDNAS